MTYNPHLPNKDVQREHDLLRRVSSLERGHGITGYRLHDILYYTADDTFTKANYTGLVAIIVECVGGGGAGGGVTADTAAGQAAIGAGGGGGSYARSLILISDLDTTEAITVGVGGTGGTGAGGTGGDSIFDTISGEVRGKSGLGGPAGAAAAFDLAFCEATLGQSGSVGDLVIRGGPSPTGFATNATRVHAPGGGNSVMGFGADTEVNATTNTGADGGLYGGGGGGGSLAQSQTTNVSGGNGGAGIVIVQLYV